MPRAGWCRECGEWVWVDSEGGCQHGHPSDCVDQIHEQQEPVLAPPTEQPSHGPAPFGVGELPGSLRRFSWGAYVLTPVWGIVYGVWPVAYVWLLTLLVPLLITSLVPSDASYAVTSLATVVSQVIATALRLWVGMNAFGWAWRREAFRLGAVADARPRRTVEAFSAAQRRWTIACAIYLALSAASLLVLATSGDPALAEAMKQLGLTPALLWISLGWTVGEVLLAVWLDFQMRRSGSVEPAGER